MISALLIVMRLGRRRSQSHCDSTPSQNRFLQCVWVVAEDHRLPRRITASDTETKELPKAVRSLKWAVEREREGSRIARSKAGILKTLKTIGVAQ
jgi:hypothetical protein